MLGRITKRFRSAVATGRNIWSAVGEQGNAVKAEYGKSKRSQIREMIALRRGPGRLAPDEYYQYGLYDDRRFDMAQKREFFGRQMERDLCKVLDSASWSAIAHDKLMSYATFRALGLPYPKIQGVFHPSRWYGDSVAMRQRQELEAFLERQACYPLVAKPIQGMWGSGIFAITEYDRDRRRLRLTSGAQVSLDEFFQALEKERHGYLFQELLRPHPALRQAVGDRICSIRLVIILDPDPIVISTLWKVATGGAMADNFWEPGNLVGPVDAATGEVGQLFTGMGLQRTPVDAHPDTGVRLVGMTLPDWQQTVQLCTQAASSLPGLKMQAWDVALTDQGPVLLEVNIIGGVRLPQLVVDRGMYHGPLLSFLNRHGYQ